jgi:flagellar protein FlaF
VSALSVAAQAAYSRPDPNVLSPRAAEYDLLGRVTRRLSDGWRQREADLAGLLAAVDENERVWSTLAQEVADPANSLPSDLRAKLFYLYEFARHHGQQVRQGKASAEILVEINTAVMRGLRGQVPA